VGGNFGFSCIFLGAPKCSHVAKIAQELKVIMPKNKFVLLVEPYIFTFFKDFFSL
jgi:hypothetical protein